MKVNPKIPQAFLSLLAKWFKYVNKYNLQAIVKLESYLGAMDDASKKETSTLTAAITNAMNFFAGIHKEQSDKVVMSITLLSTDPQVIQAAANASTSNTNLVASTPWRSCFTCKTG
jgi:hypothetical protein